MNCKSAVVFIGMTYPHGIIRHFALLAVELNKFLSRVNGVDFYFASTDGETNQNAWPLIRAEFDENRIICEHEFGKMADRICNLAGEYHKVIIHTGGGYGQTKQFIRARKRIDKSLAARLSFIGTTHSYRNDSFLRVPMSAFQYVLYRLCYRMIIFQCQYAADKFVGGNHLIRIGKGTIVPLGCEEFGEVGKEIPETISKVGLADVLCDESLFKMVYLAQFRKGKNHAWLVEALAPILKAKQKVRLILCGMGEGSVIARVREMVKTFGLEDQIYIYGQIPRCEVPWLLKHVNCAVVPSRAETFGHNFIEPMFASLPVIGTRVGIGSEVIEDGKTGFLFSLSNPYELQRAVEIMSENPESTRNMGLEAYSRVSKRFRHLDVASKLAVVYEKIITE